MLNVTNTNINLPAGLTINHNNGTKKPQQFQHQSSLPNSPTYSHDIPSHPPMFNSTDANGKKDDGAAFVRLLPPRSPLPPHTHISIGPLDPPPSLKVRRAAPLVCEKPSEDSYTQLLPSFDRLQSATSEDYTTLATTSRRVRKLPSNEFRQLINLPATNQQQPPSPNEQAGPHTSKYKVSDGLLCTELKPYIQMLQP